MNPTCSILYITYDGLLEPLGSSQVLPYVRELSKKGFQMEILSFEKEVRPDDVDSLEQQLFAEGIAWTRRPYHNRPSLPATVYDVCTGMIHATRRAYQHPGLVIHARSYIPALMALPAKKFGAKLLFDTRGLWVDERIEAGHWRADSLVVRLARQAELSCTRRAEHFVHLTSKTQVGLERNCPGIELAPFSVIPTCADLDRFTPCQDLTAARESVGLPNRPTLVHSGTISGWYLSDLTFAVGSEFVRQTGGTFLVLTREEELARELASKHEVEAVITSVPPSQMGEWLKACDAGIALVRPSFAKTASCPTKVGEYLGAGLAVAVTTGVGDLEEQLGSSGVTTLVEESDSPKKIVQGLLAGIDVPERTEEARLLAEKYWDLHRGASTYSEIYQALGATPRST